MSHWHLSSIDWLSVLPPEALTRLRHTSTMLSFHDKQTIFSPKPDPQAVFILEDGLVRMFRLSEGGGELTLGYVKPGEVFGELAAFSDKPRESYAQAVGGCTVLKVPKAVFVELMQTVPTLGYSVTKQVGLRFKRIEMLTESLVFRSVVARLAGVLLMLIEDFGGQLDGHCYIRLHLTQSEFAALSGTSRPSVNQAFQQLRIDGLAVFEKGHVVVMDLDGLRRLARGETEAETSGGPPTRPVTALGLAP